MKKNVVLLLCLFMTSMLLSCDNKFLDESEDNMPVDSYESLFLKELKETSTDRAIVENTSENSLGYDDFLNLYVNADELFSKHYNELYKIVEDEDLDIEETENALNGYLLNISDLPDDKLTTLQVSVAAMIASMTYFSESDITADRGLRSWLKKKKSRIINAAVSAACGAIIGAATGAFAGMSIPVIGYVPGAVVGAVVFGGYAAKEGYNSDSIYITSGKISL